MEIRYSRELNHNYMIIEAPEEAPGYAVRMLSANAIEGLLKFRIRQTENAAEYCYEITSRQPLKRLLEKRTLSGQELRTILLRVLSVLEKVEEYLLKEEALLLDPEYIYLEPDHFMVELCLLPGYTQEVPQALSNLLKYFLERVDHQDREAVVLAYNLYQVSLKENYGTADLLHQLSGEDRIFAVRDQKEGEKGDGDGGKENSGRQKMGIVAEDDFDPEGIGGRETILPEENRAPGWNRKTGNRELEDRVGSTKKSGWPEKAEETNGKLDGRQRSLWIRCGIRTLGSAVLAGLVYWYVTGEADSWLYMIGTGAGVLVCVREILSERKKEKRLKWQGDQGRRREYKKTADKKGDAVSRKDEKLIWQNGTISEYTPQNGSENSWQVYPESEEVYQQECQKEKEAQIERAREAGTMLLSAPGNGGENVRLEPFGTDEKVIQISYVPFTLGKHRELADACIDRPTVSRLHARIDQKEGVYILTDLNSTNGTSVNGYQLQANETVSLGNGDSIYLADAGYRFWEVR